MLMARQLSATQILTKNRGLEVAAHGKAAKYQPETDKERDA